MENARIIETVQLFPELNHKLIDLLKGLSPDEWHGPTRFPNWKVKDIAAHLLDTSIRRLSSQRDGYRPGPAASFSSDSELARFVTDLADRWASAFSGVSPDVLVELIEEYQNQLCEFLKRLEPLGRAHFPVSWAGEEVSQNWFDVAREYTERWHHQMQIRDALRREPLYEQRLYYPLLDTFMRALPFHYRNVAKEGGYTLRVEVAGESGGAWHLVRDADRWRLDYDLESEPGTTVRIDNEAAWKIFVRWIDPAEVRERVSIRGDERLGAHLLGMTCVIK